MHKNKRFKNWDKKYQVYDDILFFSYIFLTILLYYISLKFYKSIPGCTTTILNCVELCYKAPNFDIEYRLIEIKSLFINLYPQELHPLIQEMLQKNATILKNFYAFDLKKGDAQILQFLHDQMPEIIEKHNKMQQELAVTTEKLAKLHSSQKIFRLQAFVITVYIVAVVGYLIFY